MKPSLSGKLFRTPAVGGVPKACTAAASTGFRRSATAGRPQRLRRLRVPCAQASAPGILGAARPGGYATKGRQIDSISHTSRANRRAVPPAA